MYWYKQIACGLVEIISKLQLSLKEIINKIQIYANSFQQLSLNIFERKFLNAL